MQQVQSKSNKRHPGPVQCGPGISSADTLVCRKMEMGTFTEMTAKNTICYVLERVRMCSSESWGPNAR